MERCRHEQRQTKPQHKPYAHNRRKCGLQNRGVPCARKNCTKQGNKSCYAKHFLPCDAACDDLLIDQPADDGGRGERDERFAAV